MSPYTLLILSAILSVFMTDAAVIILPKNIMLSFRVNKFCFFFVSGQRSVCPAMNLHFRGAVDCELFVYENYVQNCDRKANDVELRTKSE